MLQYFVVAIHQNLFKNIVENKEYFMKTVGIIAEYNPFHKGHEYHIAKAKEVTGADFCIVVMSGDFVQRGEPALVDKHTRCEMALKCGADLVLELPVCYSTASAEYFASAAIAMLDKLKVTDYLVFGSECGDIAAMTDIAKILVDEPNEFKEILKAQLRSGQAYPVARNIAITSCLNNRPELMNILATPNNILGIEYIKALLKRDSKIKPVTITRLGADYHQAKFASEDISAIAYSSALSIRNALADNSDINRIANQVPEKVFEVLRKNQSCGRQPLFRNDFSSLLYYKLVQNRIKGFEEYADVSPELSSRICNTLPQFKDYDSFCDELKTKNITYVRVSRALLHILLNIKENDYNSLSANDYLQYANVLGFRKDASKLLNAIKKASAIPLITKPADAKNIISPFAMEMYEHNITCSHIYEGLLRDKYNCEAKNMYTESPVIITEE